MHNKLDVGVRKNRLLVTPKTGLTISSGKKLRERSGPRGKARILTSYTFRLLLDSQVAILHQ